MELGLWEINLPEEGHLHHRLRRVLKAGFLGLDSSGQFVRYATMILLDAQEQDAGVCSTGKTRAAP